MDFSIIDLNNSASSKVQWLEHCEKEGMSVVLFLVNGAKVQGKPTLCPKKEMVKVADLNRETDIDVQHITSFGK